MEVRGEVKRLKFLAVSRGLTPRRSGKGCPTRLLFFPPFSPQISIQKYISAGLQIHATFPNVAMGEVLLPYGLQLVLSNLSGDKSHHKGDQQTGPDSYEPIVSSFPI